MTSIVLKSPAKVNLLLNVLNKRTDGYHSIQTIFERINLFDTVAITLTQDNLIKVRCDNPDVPGDQRNLAYQTAALLKKRFHIPGGFIIKIKKRIPVASGLGGGSSNAACVLLGINKLLNLGLGLKQLLNFGARLGADVPFFLSGARFAWGSGRGEKITPLNIKRKFWHILVVPRFKVLTKDIYQSLDKFNKLTKRGFSSKIWFSALAEGNLAWIGKNCFNLLEEPAFKSFPCLKRLKERLKDLRLEVVLMSGSGPSVFGLVPTRKEAQELCKRLESKDGRYFVVRTY